MGRIIEYATTIMLICALVGPVGIVISAIKYFLKRPEELSKKKKEKFVELYKDFLQNVNKYEEIAHEYYEKQEKILCNHLVYKPCWIHQKGEKLLKLNDVEIKCHEFLDKEKTLENIKAQFNKAIVPDNKQDFEHNLRKLPLTREYKDQPTFAIKTFDLNEKECKATLDVYLCSFFDFLNTSIPFQYETVYEHKNKTHEEHSQKSIRKKYDILDTTKRLSTIGISVLTIFKNIKTRSATNERSENVVETSDCRFLLHKRSADVATSPNQIHVVPAGYYQPSKIQKVETQNERNEMLKRKTDHLMLTVKREFIEEIFNVDEAITYPNETVVNELLKTYQIENVFEEIYLLGCGFSPLAMNFEILAVAVIDVNQMNMGKTEEEIHNKIKNNYEGMIELRPFKKELLEHYIMNMPTTTAPLKFAFNIIINDFDNIRNQLKI